LDTEKPPTLKRELGLTLGALGVVFGDIGTSPLYAVQTVFGIDGGVVKPTPAGVYGIASLIFWALIIEVSVKYAGFIMRAHNRGDGGIMALSALIQRRKVPRAATLVTLGLLGAGLFFGDGMITPAISVTSAIGGLNVVSPSLAHLVVPLSLAILVGLFAVQRFGTGAAGSESIGPALGRKRPPAVSSALMRHSMLCPRGARSPSGTLSGAPAATASCSATRSSPSTSSVTVCSTWIRVFISRK